MNFGEFVDDFASEVPKEKKLENDLLGLTDHLLFSGFFGPFIEKNES